MKNIGLICVFLTILLAFTKGTVCNNNSKDQQDASKLEEYQCIPCGYDCDNKVYNQSGTCSKCNMELVRRNKIKFKTLQADEICNYIKSHPNTVLLDVRTKEEFEGKASPNFGTLINSINLPIQEFPGKISTLDSLKNREVIVFCSHSHRSPRASFMLNEYGFSNVINMAGGMSVLQDDTCVIRR